MGSLCSRSEPDDAEKDKGSTAIMSQPPQKKQRNQHDAGASRDHQEDITSARRMIQAHDATIAVLNPAQQTALGRGDLKTTDRFDSVDDYLNLRGHILSLEKTLDFDFRCRANSTPEERIADSIVRRLRREDNVGIYDEAPPRKGFGGQQHPRFAGDHFLSNVPLINQTAIFNVARHMPKGAHLHIHFNACLMPHVLLDIAKGMERMFITSNIPLLPSHNFENFDRCEIQFSIMSPEKESPGDIFSAAYQPRQTMRFKDFLRCFPQKYSRATADDWLLNKLMFHEQEAHNHLQTAEG